MVYQLESLLIVKEMISHGTQSYIPRVRHLIPPKKDVLNQDSGTYGLEHKKAVF